MAATEPLLQTHPHRRRVERDACDLVTAITRGFELRLSGRVADICPFGCCVRSDAVFEKDDRIRLLLPIIGDVEARVAWTLVGVFGCEFTDPIAPEQYPLVLAAIKTRRDSWPSA